MEETTSPQPPISFAVEARDPGSAARAGTLTTPHGAVATPMFMPVGTQASVKALAPEDLHGLGAGIILSNTYHLLLRPGPELIAEFGGLHRFMGWDGPILTDSGGFQVFSLGHLRKLTDDGVTFHSHLDGQIITLTPERVIAIEELLGPDIILPLDECPPYPCDDATTQRATARTHRWAERAVAAKRRPDQALFGIPQGGMLAELRTWSAETIAALPFSGFSIGGLSVGEPKELMWPMVEASVAGLDALRPRHLLGVGSPEDLVEGVARGIDLFDCVLPTRTARNGGLYTADGRVSIRGARWRAEQGPVMPGCDCWTCSRFSAGYLHHLARAEELLYYRLGSIHNLRFLVRLMAEMRVAIGAGTFAAWRAAFTARYRPASAAKRTEQREKWLAKHGANPDRAT
ncbi:MAG: tRNA guanosine(34) transglycosylase Tgt [Ktedonobacterales bacterium]|nr:tRNA guanosine(34) transglycosylase Tgt [Ktedonobacterales bacterium]